MNAALMDRFPQGGIVQLLRHALVLAVLVAALAWLEFETSGITSAVEGDPASFSIEDLSAIRAALLDYLRNSDLGDRDELIAFTQNAQETIDDDGTRRIGLWRLQSGREGGTSLVIRFVDAEDLIVNYRAAVTRHDRHWAIGAVEAEFFHGRREG